MVVTILTDIIHFGIYYPSADLIGRDLFRFSAGMAILSLLLKPVSCFFVYQMYRERGGDYNVTFGKCSNFIIKKFLVHFRLQSLKAFFIMHSYMLPTVQG